MIVLQNHMHCIIENISSNAHEFMQPCALDAHATAQPKRDAHEGTSRLGVPLTTRTLGGGDSLYSIVQMPPGIPVATVAIGAGRNAGLLAVRMLATNDPALAEKLEELEEKHVALVQEMNEGLG